jgi:hypothetical protein
LAGVLDRGAPVTLHSAAGSELPAPVKKGDAIEEMPVYASEGVELVGKAQLKPGEHFHFLGWPLDRFAAVNAPAQAVKEYFARNKHHPDLLSSPWCCLHRTVVLPELPPIEGDLTEEGDRQDA